MIATKLYDSLLRIEGGNKYDSVVGG